MTAMRSSGNFALTKFRVYLVEVRGLSPSTAETYVKQARRALRRVGWPAVGLADYDSTLSVKMQENFRAAWRHLVAFGATTGKSWPLPPSRRAPTNPKGFKDVTDQLSAKADSVTEDSELPETDAAEQGDGPRSAT